MPATTARRRAFRWAALVSLALLGPAAADPPRLDPSGDPLPPGAVMRLGSLRFRGSDLIFGKRQYLPDGRTLLIYNTNPIQWRDADTGREIDHYRLPPNVWGCAASRDGRLMLAVDQESLKLWNLKTRRPVRTLELSGLLTQVITATFAPDGRSVAAVSIGMQNGQNRYQLRLWDVASGRELWRAGDGSPFLIDFPAKLSFRPDGRSLVVLDRNNGVSVLDRDTGRPLRCFPTVAPPEANGTCILSPDGSAVLVCTSHPVVRVWDVNTGQERAPLEGRSTYCAFTPDGSLLATDGDPFVLVREWPSGRLRARIDIGQGGLWALSLTPGGKRLEVTFLGEATVRQYDVATGRAIPPADGHFNHIIAVRYLPDGTILTVAGDNTVRIWNPATGRTLRQFPLAYPCNGPSAVALGPGGRTLATASGNSGDQTVRVWDVATGRELRKSTHGFMAAHALAASPGGKLFAVGAGEFPLPAPCGLKLFDGVTGERLRHQTAKPVSALAFSPDGRLLAGLEESILHVWDAASGRPLRAFAESTGPVAFSPDGRSVACGGWKGGVTVYEFASGQARLRCKGPDGLWGRLYGNFLRFSPDGRWLAGSGGGDAVLWDAQTGEQVEALTGHRGGVTDIDFAPDGRTLATAGWDTTALIWPVPDRPREPLGLSADAAAAAWADLASPDAVAAYRAIHRLCTDPARAVPLLRDRLRQVRPPDPARVARLIAELESERFAAREAATHELEALGELAEPALRRLLAERPTLEQRRRAERLLEGIGGLVTSAEGLRVRRGVEALQRIGTPEARQALEELAKGDLAAPLTREAAAALGRLRR
jgi:WD40 repeat protein